uniref:Uncharacterized protein n=1 Tax=Rhizophora mucronata TaxID=61149 RepID=A0A2P2MC41_RHIMU
MFLGVQATVSMIVLDLTMVASLVFGQFIYQVFFAK